MITAMNSFQRLASTLLAICIMLSWNALADDGHWVTTWGTGPQLTEPNNLPPVPLSEKTLRQFVRTSIPGKQLRVRFTNAYGDSPVTLKSARIALSAGEGSGGTGEIDPESDRALSFKGAPSVVLMPGQSVSSDAIAFELPVTADVALSVHFGKISASAVTGHPGSRTTSFIASGDLTSAADLPSAAKTDHWYIIQGIDVLAEEEGRAVVILGDSITDGRGSTTNGNNRWPDLLAKRFAENPPTDDVATVNMGIGGNGIFGGLGPSAIRRFERDVLKQPGARYLIVFEGVNDIGGSNNPNVATNLIIAFKDFAAQARARNIKPYAATITPFGQSGYYSPAHETARQTVNAWIRDNEDFDGFIDFDAAVRDPSAPVNLLPAYSSDGLHLSPQGLQAMADAVDLNLFVP